MLSSIMFYLPATLVVLGDLHDPFYFHDAMMINNFLFLSFSFYLMHANKLFPMDNCQREINKFIQRILETQDKDFLGCVAAQSEVFVSTNTTTPG